MISGIPIDRYTATLVTRIRTGYLRVYEHLVERGWVEFLICECGFEEKTLRHLLLDCPIYSAGREHFLNILSGAESDTTDPGINLRITAYNQLPKAAFEIQKFFKQSQTYV